MLNTISMSGMIVVLAGCALVGTVGCGGGSSGTADAGTAASGGGNTGAGGGGTTTPGNGGRAGGGRGGSSGPTSSGVDGSKQIDSLTLDEKRKLCDFENAYFGGYGGSIECDGGAPLQAAASQAECVSKMQTNCAATISQAEACYKEITCEPALPVSCNPLLSCR